MLSFSFRTLSPSLDPPGSLSSLSVADPHYPVWSPLCSSWQTSGRSPRRSCSSSLGPRTRCRSAWADRWRRRWQSCRGPVLPGGRWEEANVIFVNMLVRNSWLDINSGQGEVKGDSHATFVGMLFSNKFLPRLLFGLKMTTWEEVNIRQE